MLSRLFLFFSENKFTQMVESVGRVRRKADFFSGVWEVFCRFSEKEDGFGEKAQRIPLYVVV